MHAFSKSAFSGLLTMERNDIFIIKIDRARENSPVTQASSKRLYSVDPVCG
jgi:hypothetical protein